MLDPEVEQELNERFLGLQAMRDYRAEPKKPTFWDGVKSGLTPNLSAEEGEFYGEMLGQGALGLLVVIVLVLPALVVLVKFVFPFMSWVSGK